MRVGGGIKSILANGMMLAGTGWIETLFRVVYLIAITRLLGPEGYGLWSYALVACGFVVALTSFGFETVLHFAYGDSTKNGDKVTQAALFWRLITMVIVLPAFAVFVSLFTYEADVSLALFVVMPALFGRTFAHLVRNIFIAKESVKRSLRFVIVFRILEVAIGTLMLLSGAQVELILALHSVIWFCEAIWGLRIVNKEYGLKFARPANETTIELWRKGLPMAGIGAITAWLMSAPILLFKAYSADLGTLGQLSVALMLINLLVATSQSFLLAAVPVLNRSDKQGDQRVGLYGVSVLVATVAIFGSAALVMHLFGTAIFVAGLGDEYVLASQLAVPAVAIAGLQVLPSGFLQLMVVRGKYWPGLVAGGLGCVVMTFGFIYFGAQLDPFLAIYIACAAWACRAIVGILIAMLTTVKRTGS